MLRELNLIKRMEASSADSARTVKGINEAASKLDGLRAIEIVVSDSFARSKIAWKLGTYQHVLLHRICSLFDGAALAWNARSTLSAFLSARALMETCALYVAYGDSVDKFLRKEDLESLNKLAQFGLFSSRDSNWLKLAPDYQAINALTYIDKLDKLAPGLRRHYDSLSERCHPNMMGHLYMFSELDRSDGTVRFLDERDPEANQLLFLGGVMVVSLAANKTETLTAHIFDVAELQHRIQPVSAGTS